MNSSTSSLRLPKWRNSFEVTVEALVRGVVLRRPYPRVVLLDAELLAPGAELRAVVMPYLLHLPVEEVVQPQQEVFCCTVDFDGYMRANASFE